jgi:hypothetical protein
MATLYALSEYIRKGFDKHRVSLASRAQGSADAECGSDGHPPKPPVKDGAAIGGPDEPGHDD